MIYWETLPFACFRNNIGVQVQEYGNKTERRKENRQVCYKSVAGNGMHDHSAPIQHHQKVYSDYTVMYLPVDRIGRSGYVKRDHYQACLLYTSPSPRDHG